VGETENMSHVIFNPSIRGGGGTSGKKLAYMGGTGLFFPGRKSTRKTTVELGRMNFALKRKMHKNTTFIQEIMTKYHFFAKILLSLVSKKQQCHEIFSKM
jgi:hypothetical protein